MYMVNFLRLLVNTNTVVNSDGDDVIQIFVTSNRPKIDVRIGLTPSDLNQFVDRYLRVLRAEILRQISLDKDAKLYDIEYSNFDEITNFVLNLSFNNKIFNKC